MTQLDQGLLLLVNSVAGRSPTVDSLVALLAGNMLLKGAVFVYLFWWLWFRREPRQTFHREFLVLGTVAPVLAVLAARVVAHLAPFRLRPLHEATLGLRLPYGFDPGTLQGWSSFPSDHAAFFFAVSVVFLLVNRRAGLFAITYSSLLICVPRMYLGIHYPSDLFVGALIGAAVALLTLFAPVRRWFALPVLRYLEVNPGVGYGCLALLSYLIGTVCEPVPELIRAGFRLASLFFEAFGYPMDASPGKQSMVEPLITLAAALAIILMLAEFRRRVVAKNIAQKTITIRNDSIEQVRRAS